ncbi:hypothetical protein ABIB25_002631 [Nakamurella sp. UYEF19]|uniref:hypothetical protein n=1 Tax=Nakamurella sp. UYEF19 TaxID=1756392 RepID=UPI00339311B5
MLVSKYFGAYWNQIPTFTAGWIDPDVLAALAENYLDSPEAEVDLRDLDVTDGPIDHIAYRAAGTTTTRGVSAYLADFDVSQIDLPAEQVPARQAFNDLRATVFGRADATQDWTPSACH